MKIMSLSRIAAVAILALSLALGAAAPAVSQEIPPEQLSLARKYVDLTNRPGMFEAVLTPTVVRLSKLLTQQNPDISKQIDETILRVFEPYRTKNDDLFNQYARIYATEFTVDELNQMVAFYESPVGKKLVEKSLEFNAGIRAATDVYLRNFGTELMTKVRADLKAQGFNV